MIYIITLTKGVADENPTWNIPELKTVYAHSIRNDF
jgi:hypothetical protein